MHTPCTPLIHWFNPENDLALASGIAAYTPPKAGVMIREAGQALPLWYADSGDILLIQSADERWYDKIKKDFGMETTVSTLAEKGYEPRPWGWSAYARHTLIHKGCDESLMPTIAETERIRLLSHRRTAATVSAILHEELPDMDLAAVPTECRDIDEARRALARYGDAYLKMPWSSSGRGVVCTRGATTAKIMRFAEDCIRSQGSVMVEKAYDKAIDFARLFRCSDGVCEDIGTSVFTTDARGAYTGNLLAPESERIAMIAPYYNERLLHKAVSALASILSRTIAPHYSGILGVDMLVDRTGRLDAVVEINLRSTMGYVANTFADKYLTPGTTGRFVSTRIDRIDEKYAIEGGKLVKGTLALSPITGGFGFFAVTK